MKKLFTLLTIALSLFMVSCDEDVDRAIMLSGQWKGDLGAAYDDGIRTYYADYSDIVFYPSSNYSTHGTGREIDFYSVGPEPYVYSEFDWEINNGRIYLTFYNYNHHRLDAIIDDYRMTNDYFSGVISNYYGDTSFRLYKIVDYYDWDYYKNGYDPYYYAKSRSVKQNADSTVVNNDSLEIRPRRVFKNKQK